MCWNHADSWHIRSKIGGKIQKPKVVENRIPNKSCFQTHFQILRPILDHSLRHPYRSDIMFRPRADRHVRFDSQGDVSRGYGNWIAGWKISKNKSCRESNSEQLLFSHTFPNFTTNFRISDQSWTETSRDSTYNINLWEIPVGSLREIITWIWKLDPRMENLKK